MEEVQKEVDGSETSPRHEVEEVTVKRPLFEEPQKPRGYAILDLHLNQFLSFIAEEYSFLPSAIYRPRIDVYLNKNLVYKSTVLSHDNDVFGNVIRLRIHSPNSVVTLKLYECVQLRLTEHCVDELIRPVLKDEPMDEVLISWCDFDVGLFIPFKRYDMVCAFRVNPMFLRYNPGGILYYPTFKGKPFIDNKRVCCACRVCVYLSSHTNSVHKKMLGKYFDFRYDLREVDKPIRSSVAGAVDDSALDSGRTDSYYTESARTDISKYVVSGDDSRDTSPQTLLKTVDHMNYMSEEEKMGIRKETNPVETFEMNVKRVFFTREGCTCCRLADVPNQLRGLNYTPCLCCHDYQVCCEHSVENYYYASVSMKLVSKQSIGFKTELMALMSNPIPFNAKVKAQKASLCTILTRFYEVHAALGVLHKHLGIPNLQNVRQQYMYIAFVLLLLVFLFEGKLITAACFLLGFLTLSISTTSSKQYHTDFGDVIDASKRLTFSGEGLEKVIRDMIEKEEANKIEEPVSRFQRNMVYIPKHEFVDEVRIYSKLDTSLNRSENIALKTTTNFLSSSVPKKARQLMLTALDYCEGIIWSINALLAIIRWYGIPLSIFFCGLGALSLWYIFWIKCAMKTIIIVLLTSYMVENNPIVQLCIIQLKHLFMYFTMRIRRREWFLNVESFP